MSDKDWVALLSPCGNARQYFKNATGGAAWVDKMCDQIVEALTLPQGLSDDEIGILQKLTENPLTRKIRINRNVDKRWEVAVDFMDVGSWTVVVDSTIPDAVTKLYDQEHKIRLKYGMKQLGEHHAG